MLQSNIVPLISIDSTSSDAKKSKVLKIMLQRRYVIINSGLYRWCLFDDEDGTAVYLELLSYPTAKQMTKARALPCWFQYDQQLAVPARFSLVEFQGYLGSEPWPVWLHEEIVLLGLLYDNDRTDQHSLHSGIDIGRSLIGVLPRDDVSDEILGEEYSQEISSEEAVNLLRCAGKAWFDAVPGSLLDHLHKRYSEYDTATRDSRAEPYMKPGSLQDAIYVEKGQELLDPDLTSELCNIIAYLGSGNSMYSTRDFQSGIRSRIFSMRTGSSQQEAHMEAP